jgi:hypothetical protein
LKVFFGKKADNFFGYRFDDDLVVISKSVVSVDLVWWTKRLLFGADVVCYFIHMHVLQYWSI